MKLSKHFRIYTDTSVVGGCLDEEFQEPSLRLFEAARRGEITVLVSDLVIAELADAPEEVRAVLPSVPVAALEVVPLTGEVLALREACLDAGVVDPRWIDDATHVAAATAARADAIVSWNFRHIVHLGRIKGYNAVNIREGFGLITILSPREVRFDDPSEEDI